MSQFPQWPISLANLGKNLYEAVKDKSSPPFTFALCMPRLNFAALCIGVGILCKHINSAKSSSEEQKIKELLGQSVIFNKGTKKIGGILEYCEIRNSYKILQYDRTKKRKLKPGDSLAKAVVLARNEWNAVRSADFEFSLERGASKAQIERLSVRLSALEALAPVFGIPNDADANEAKCLFTVAGNKTRVLDELTQDLQVGTFSCLKGILRPQSFPEFASSFRCRLESSKCQITDDSGILIAEASRSLGDLLRSSRSKHRVVLLGRNSAEYEECSNLILDAFRSRKNGMPDVIYDLPQTLRVLAFYQS
jgi:hypothetical protein